VAGGILVPRDEALQPPPRSQDVREFRLSRMTGGGGIERKSLRACCLSYNVGSDNHMDAPRPRPVTLLLQNWRQGDQAALGQIAEMVDRELHRLAASYLRRERPGHTLQPTALVNEAFVRLVGPAAQPDWQSRSHFVAIAAHHMRQILVDYARRHRSAKRGAGATMISLDDAHAASEPRPVDLLALDQALEKLAEVDGRKARAMELKFFGGLEMAEIGSVLGVSVKTVEKDVRLGAAWLRSALSTPPAA
jgi:RNA polymerase sigma-70 factor (ECF subfamily)